MRRTLGTLALLLINVGGCRWFETWARCDDAGCRARTVEAGFQEDPGAVLYTLRQMQDPLEQAALVEQLAHAFPQYQADICGVAGPGSPALFRCQRLRLRPHLYEQQHLKRDSDQDRSRAGAGPAESTPPVADLPRPWTDDAATRAVSQGDCGEDRTCISDRSRALALEGKVAEAGLGCALAWPEHSAARDECLFVAAEALVVVGGMSRVRDALALCSAAGEIGRNCTQHVLIEAIPDPPPADTPDQARVAQALQAVALFQDGWPEPQRSFYTQFFWAVWTRDAFAHANRLTGHLLAALPAEATPHVRAAAAWRFAQIASRTFQNLDDVALRLQGLLDVGGPLAQDAVDTATGAFRVDQSQPNTFWTSDAVELEAEIPSTLFIGSGRRALAPDPLDDLRIALLEAAARTSPPIGRNFFYDAMQSQASPHVRWTAARLLATVYGDAVVQQGVRSDDPLIQAGLDYAYNRPKLP